MAQYINKDALVAEIESLKSAAETMLTGKTDLSYWKAQKCLCERFLSFLNTLEVKEVDLEFEIKKIQKEYKTIDEYDGYPATIYASSIERIAKHFFELGMSVSNKAQKGDNMTKEIEEIKECDGKISSNIVTDENNWYVCIKQFNNFEVGKVYCIGKNSVIAVPEYFRLATDEEIAQGASMQNTDTTEPTGVRLEKCPKAQKGEEV